MQEEVEQRVVTLVVDCAKLTEQELRKALTKMLEKLKAQKQGKQPHGKMTVKQLAAQNKGMQSIEVTDKNIGSFTKIARKYGIDFAPFKAKDQDRYLIFFKAQNGRTFLFLNHLRGIFLKGIKCLSSFYERNERKTYGSYRG